MERSEPTAEASLAAMRERIRFGMAMAATIRITATTISNSISEKPYCFERMSYLDLQQPFHNRVEGTAHCAFPACLESTTPRGSSSICLQRRKGALSFFEAARAPCRICCAGIHFWITGDNTGIIRLQKDAFGARELCLSAFSQGEV